MTDEAARRIYDLVCVVRGHLEEQCFWAYPPPYVDADMRPERARSIEALATERDGALNASLELYRRYKYGRQERKWFRDRARRLAAREMVELYCKTREWSNAE